MSDKIEFPKPDNGQDQWRLYVNDTDAGTVDALGPFTVPVSIPGGPEPEPANIITPIVQEYIDFLIAAERQRCAGIVENVLDRHRNGESMDDDLLAQDLKDEIIGEINEA